MKNTKAIYTLCCLIAAALFGAGFLPARQWLGFAAALVLILFSLLPDRYYPEWISVVQLIGFLMVASSGLLLESFPFLFIAGLIFALVILEMRKHVFIPSKSIYDSEQRTFERTHLIWLGIACMLSLIITGICLLVKIKIPFILMVIIVAGIAFTNYRLIKLLLHGTENC